MPLLRSAAGVPVVRVRLLEGQSSLRLSASADPTFSVGGSAPRTLAMAGRSIVITLTPQGWSLGGAIVGTPAGGAGGAGTLAIQQRPEGSITVNNTTYRGSFRLVPRGGTAGSPGGAAGGAAMASATLGSGAAGVAAAAAGGLRFDLVNDVEVDAYLKSVVSKELYKGWASETYRAQAVAARTYALYELATAGSSRHWDVYDDERSQVYGGLQAESALSQSAVDATAGIVLAWGEPGQERIFKTYFSACCGGLGQNPTDAFLSDPNIPPLAEKNAGTLCSASPRYRWGPVQISKAEATRRVRLWAQKRNRPEQGIGPIGAIETSHLNRLGRPIRYMLTDTRGQRYSLSAEELRTALNTGGEGRTVFSSHMVFASNATHFAINGAGLGHGVGMCQYCAQALALQGRRHEEILRYSYPTAQLIRAY